MLKFRQNNGELQVKSPASHFGHTHNNKFPLTSQEGQSNLFSFSLVFFRRNTLRVTRAATLDSTDTSGQTKEYFLGKEGKNFEFSQLSPMKVEFTECICKGSEEKATDVESIEEWIKKVAK